jgi:hypothetical protein
MLLACLFGLFLIGIADGHNFFVAAMLDVTGSLAAGPDATDAQLFSGAWSPRARFSNGRKSGRPSRR